MAIDAVKKQAGIDAGEEGWQRAVASPLDAGYDMALDRQPKREALSRYPIQCSFTEPRQR
jgi:hypothetical protein